MSKTKKNRVVSEVVFSYAESGASDSWTWVGTLTIDADGARHFLLEQVVDYPTEDNYENSYELKNIESGGHLRGFIESAWNENHEEPFVEDDWHEIVAEIRKLDAHLAASLEESVRAEFEDEDDEDDESEPEVDPFEDHCSRATWPKESTNMWAGLAEAQRARSEIRLYARRYQDERGSMPTGVHRVEFSFGDTKTDVTYPESDKS